MGGEEPPCEGCVSAEAISLSVVDSLNLTDKLSEPLVLDAQDSGAIALLPVVRLEAKAPEACKFCDAFSESAVEFDFAGKEEATLRKAFPGREMVLLFPGEGQVVPLSDSLWWNAWVRELKDSMPTDGKLFVKLRERYPVFRYIAVPWEVSVEILPELGVSGGYRYRFAWMFWDAQEGKLLWWVRRDQTAKTQGATPPDRGWFLGL